MKRKTACLIALALLLGGCGGGGEGGGDAAADRPAVDPRYATPEALLAHTESVLNREPSDIETWVGLFYWETPRQEQIKALMNVMLLPTVRFQQALQAKFGAEAVDASVLPSMKMTSSRITSNDGSRVEATYTNEDDETASAMLVKIGDRWWISGYTVEHDPEFIAGQAESGMTLDKMLELSGKLAGLGPAIDQLAQRVRAGEFGSAQQAQVAYQSTFFGEVMKVGMQEAFTGSGLPGGGGSP